jgi:hypothetical protein
MSLMVYHRLLDLIHHQIMDHPEGHSEQYVEQKVQMRQDGFLTCPLVLVKGMMTVMIIVQEIVMVIGARRCVIYS